MVERKEEEEEEEVLLVADYHHHHHHHYKKKIYGLKYVICLSFSVLLNFFLVGNLFVIRGGELSWSRGAAIEAEAVASLSCSGHGRAYLDGLLSLDGTNICECNTCYGGLDCSQFSPDCPADVDSGPGTWFANPFLPIGDALVQIIPVPCGACNMGSSPVWRLNGGDPLFLEPFWMRNAASSAVMVAGWHRMSYRLDDGSYISKELEKLIRELHAVIGNADTTGKYMVFGAGSTQLLNAAIYALSPEDSPSPSSVVASKPFYPLYKLQTDLFKSMEFNWQGDTSMWTNISNNSSMNFIEFVTSPNNPDGKLKKPVLNYEGLSDKVIYDHAYYWPHFSAIVAPANEDLMIFTLSKITGHAGSRFGWALIKDEGTYERIKRYIGLNTMGVSRDAQLRALKLLKVVLKGEREFFEFGHKTTKIRWERLNKVVSASKRFSLQKLKPQYCTYFQNVTQPSPAYAWMKCEREEDQDCNAVLRGAGIIGRKGSIFNAGDRYVRLSLIKTQDDFDQLLQKMDALVSKDIISGGAQRI